MQRRYPLTPTEPPEDGSNYARFANRIVNRCQDTGLILLAVLALTAALAALACEILMIITIASTWQQVRSGNGWTVSQLLPATPGGLLTSATGISLAVRAMRNRGTAQPLVDAISTPPSDRGPDATADTPDPQNADTPALSDSPTQGRH